jgi:uncharacterized protein
VDAVLALLDLQKIDIVRDRLHERLEHLPERVELTDVEGRIAEMNAAIARVSKEAETVEREERRVEEEVRLLEEKIGQEESKLYSGAVQNPKELSALQAEIEMLKRRKSPLEETGLEQLETRDQLLEERARLEAELADLEQEASGVRSRIQAVTGEIQGELGTEDTKRAEIVPKIPSDVVERYEELRGAKRGIGVGALENGICTACREALSAVETDKIRRQVREGEWLFRCEHCRRLLVVP